MSAHPFQILCAVVAEAHGMEPSDLLGRRLAREYTQPRQMLAYLARDLIKMSYAHIGGFMERNQKTIGYACRAVEGRLARERWVQDQVKAIADEFSRRMTMKEAA